MKRALFDGLFVAFLCGLRGRGERFSWIPRKAPLKERENADSSPVWRWRWLWPKAGQWT